MVRTEADPGRTVRFERVEQDGRRHAAWMMEARVTPDATAASGAARPASLLVVRLRYAGSFGTGLLERALRDEIERGRERLAAALSG
jgi:hypothetical protein